MSEAQIYQILSHYWGYKRFRPQQEEIIRSILAGHDTLALMPTGGGKSLTYQVPAMALRGICIVISPLIALMKDQVDRLRKIGIKAVALHAGLSREEVDRLLDNCVHGDIKFLYIAPERIPTELFRLRLRQMKVSLFAIDEAHCISQWGYDFRPAYLAIKQLRQIHPTVPMLALTASATELVTKDIQDQLLFKEPCLIRSAFLRPNLSYSVRPTEDKFGQLLRIIRNVGGSGIVYVRRREEAVQLAKELTEEMISATFYHGGLPHEERNRRQEEWIEGKVAVMVSTNAFGMGIDKADVRFVVHYTLCDSLESYYQEAGRAGRDGQRAYAVLLFTDSDREVMAQSLEREFPPLEDIKTLYEELFLFLQIPLGEGGQTSHIFNIFDFCARFHRYEGWVMSAIKLLQLNGYLTLTDAHDHPARLMFTVSRDDLYRFRFRHEELDQFLRTLLRLYPGIFTEFRPINEMELATWSGYTPAKVKEYLARLWQQRIIRYIPSNREPMLVLHQPRLPKRDVVISPESYLRRRTLMRDRFELMWAYALSTECRSTILDHYFGGTDSTPCGICDNCLARKRAAKQEATLYTPEQRTQVLERIAQSECDIRTISLSVSIGSEGLKHLIKELHHEGLIEVDATGFCKISPDKGGDSQI